MVNPDEESLPESELDLIVAGTDEAILMVEAGANEITEAEILDALDIAHDEIKKLCQAQRDLREKAGKEKSEVEVPQVDDGAPPTRSRIARRRRSIAATAGRGQARAPGRDQAGRGGGARGAHARGRRRRTTRSAAPPCSWRSTSSRRTSSAGGSRSTSSGPTVAQPTRSGRSRSRSKVRPAHARLGALHARPDAGAHRSRRSARRARSSGSTRSGSRPRSATSTTTTSRRSRSGRPASCAAPSAATSATVRSPSGPSCR